MKTKAVKITNKKSLRLVLIIELGNDAMRSKPEVLGAINRSELRAREYTPMNKADFGYLNDINGNRTGEWHVEEWDD